MRWLTPTLIALLLAVWGGLLFGKGSVPHVMGLRAELQTAQLANEAARERNARLLAEVNDLKEGLEMVEEQARSALGMVKADEILVLVSPGGSAPAVSPSPAAAPSPSNGASR
jgi:cell division protein FtsB